MSRSVVLPVQKGKRELLTKGNATWNHSLDTTYAYAFIRIIICFNCQQYDWQFTEGGLHNHLSHSILAAFSLGASPQLIQVRAHFTA